MKDVKSEEDQKQRRENTKIGTEKEGKRKRKIEKKRVKGSWERLTFL
jgi:hypothetical protein